MPNGCSKIQPIPSANFASPSPIHLPPEKSQRAKSGNAAIGPANTTPRDGYRLNDNRNAIPAKPYAHSSGMIVWRISYTAIAIKSEMQTSEAINRKRSIGDVRNPGNKAAPTRANRSAVRASTSGYCHEILLPQCLHRPRRKSHEKTGTRSSAVKVLPHEAQWLRPERDSTPLRSTNTFRKLPMMRPNIANAIVTKSIFASIPPQ